MDRRGRKLMLSRSAERIFWAGRYLERAENTARIIQQYSQLLLDLPDETDVGWQELIQIFGAHDAFAQTEKPSDEQTILEFLLADSRSGQSLNFSIRMARDNIRNSRDLLPLECWEYVNELYHFANKQLSATGTDANRFEVLSECIGRCQQINGALVGTMSHESPYFFLRLGQNIERADMTSRIVDVAAAYLQKNERLVLRYGSTLWTNVLKSVGGFQMYRQYQQPAVEGIAAIDFLLNDTAFPRAIRASILQAKRSAKTLPRSEQLIESLKTAEESLPSPVPSDFDGSSVSRVMDVMQKRLADVHNSVVNTWFLHL